MGAALKRIESKTGPTETNSLGAPALRGFAKSLKPNQLCFPGNWKPFKPLIFSQRLLLTFVGYTTDETQHKSHKQIFIFRLTFFLILKLFECHCCNFRHTKTKTLPFPLGRRLGWWQWWGGWPNFFASNVFCSFFFAREEERDLLRERRVRFYFPLSVSGPTMNTKCWQNTNTTCKYTNTQKTKTQMKRCSCKYKAIMEGFFFVQSEI